MRKGYKAHPLTSMQKLHFYYLRYRPKKQTLSIGPNLAIQMGLDWDVFKDCIREAIVRCDTMCLCFTHDKEGDVYQYVVKEEIKETEHPDFTGWKEEDVEGKFREWIEIPFERYDFPMHHTVVIRMLDGYQGLYICVDHMIMDAQSLALSSRDMIELYANKLYDEVDHPKGMSSYIKQLEKDLAHETGSKACERDRQFFQELTASSELTFMDIYGPRKLSDERKTAHNLKLRAVTDTSDNAEANITNFHLEGDSSGRLLDSREKYGTSMACLLLMDLRTYPQRENDQDDVSITTTVSKRTTPSERCCGGSRIHCSLFRIIVSRENTSMEGFLKIKDAQNQYLRHADYSPSEYFNYRHDYYKLKDGQICEPLSSTYQPLAMEYDGSGLDKLGDIRHKTAYYSDGVVAHTLYLIVSHRAEDNDLDSGLEYQTGVVTLERPEYTYYYLCRIIPWGAEDPGHTIRGIIETV